MRGYKNSRKKIKNSSSYPEDKVNIKYKQRLIAGWRH